MAELAAHIIRAVEAGAAHQHDLFYGLAGEATALLEAKTPPNQMAYLLTETCLFIETSTTRGA